MKILKKNQLVILVIALMLITAGYLNYTDKISNQTMETAMEIAELGDATLVSSQLLEDKEETESSNQVSLEDLEEKDTIETNAEVEDTYFTSSKLERDSMYSQMLETYQEIYNNVNSTAEQKNTAINEIAKINKQKNAIMIAENLIKTKGFTDVTIFVNSSSISVITSEELAQEQIAQIQNIVSRELEVDAGIIHISSKK